MTSGERSSRTEQGGDPICWVDRACPECGRFADDETVDTDDPRCAECGAELSI